MIEQILTALLKFFYNLTKEDDTIKNVQTPPDVRKRWNAWVSDKLRDKNVGAGPQN